MNSKRLVDLRDALSRAVRDMARDGDLSSRQIARSFLQENHDLIAANQIDLNEIAIVKLISDVSERRRSTRSSNSGDLFEEFSLPSVTTLANIYNPSAPAVRTSFEKMTANDVERWILQHSKPKSSSAKKISEARRLLENLRPYMGPTTTIGEGWSVRKATLGTGLLN